MSEQLNRQTYDQSLQAQLSRDDADRLIQVLLQARQAQDQNGETDDYRYNDESNVQNLEEQPMVEQMSHPLKRSKPSDWGASAVIDTALPQQYYSGPLDKEQLRFPSKKVLIALGVTAVWTSIISYSVYDSEIDNPYSAIASLPIIGKSDPAKKELVDSLIANCAEGSVGESLSTGSIAAEASIIWNVPNDDGTLSPLSPTRFDRKSKVERHPHAVIEDSTLTIGGCDTGGRPAITIRDKQVVIDLAAIESRVALGRDKVRAEGIPKEYLDKSVKLKAFSQATADALFAAMTDRKNAAEAVGNALHDAGGILTARNSSYDNEIEDVTVGEIVSHVRQQLKIKSPGIDYTIETVNEVPDTTLVGITKVDASEFSVVDTKITKATIVVDPNTEKS